MSSFKVHKRKILQCNYKYKTSDICSIINLISFLIYSINVSKNSSLSSIIRIIRNYYREKYNLFSDNITNQDFINIFYDLETKRTIIIEKINNFSSYRKNQKKNNFRCISKKDKEKLELIYDESISFWC